MKASPAIIVISESKDSWISRWLQYPRVAPERKQRLMYTFTIDVTTTSNSRVHSRTAAAFALYNPTTKHDWMSRSYAMEKLGILNYSPLLPEDLDSESTSAIGQVEVYWACYELSPYMQKATFLIAPNAGFDVLFGYETGSIQRGSCEKCIRKGKLTAVKGDQARHYQSNTYQQEQQEYCGSLVCEMPFVRGIENGTLVPVDNEAKDTARRPSIADLENHYHRELQ